MSNRKLVIRAALAIVAGLGVVPTGWAATATSNVTVTATVPQTCTISTSNVAFGTYDPVTTNSLTGADINTAGGANGAVSVTCTKSSAGVTVDLGAGSNYAAPDRQMASGSERLKYQLYKASDQVPGTACAGTPAGSAGVWGATASGTTLTPSTPNWSAAAARSFNICGFVAKGQDVAPGAYTDTVVATVTY